MTHDPLEKEKLLRNKLNEYHVEVPDFPMKNNRGKLERLIAFLASPAKDPFEKIIISHNGVLHLKVAPILVVLALSLLQLIVVL